MEVTALSNSSNQFHLFSQVISKFFRATSHKVIWERNPSSRVLLKSYSPEWKMPRIATSRLLRCTKANQSKGNNPKCYNLGSHLSRTVQRTFHTCRSLCKISKRCSRRKLAIYERKLITYNSLMKARAAYLLVFLRLRVIIQEEPNKRIPRWDKAFRKCD